MLDEVHVPPVVADANSVVEPEHTLVAPVIAATVGIGFTITSTVKLLPGHELYKGVTVYVTV